jgi:hypothetical protein
MFMAFWLRSPRYEDDAGSSTEPPAPGL